MKTNLDIYTLSSGYTVQFFSIFKNNPNFCLKEKNIVSALYAEKNFGNSGYILVSFLYM